MIIANGCIRYIYSCEDGGIDADTGYPSASVEKMGRPIPCQYSPRTLNVLATSNGEHQIEQGYTILIELNRDKKSERLALFDKFRNEVGRFSVRSVEPLDAVWQEKITI